MRDIKIETFSPRYADAVFDLILPIQTQEYGIEISRHDQPDLERIPEFYQIGKGNFWIALHSNKVVGSIALLDIGEDQLALRKMFVHKDYRGKEKGVAQSLLNEAFVWAQCNGITDIFLGTTAQFKAAHRFYEKNFFVEIEREALPKRFPVMNVDSKFFRYHFSS